MTTPRLLALSRLTLEASTAWNLDVSITHEAYRDFVDRGAP